MTACTLMLAVMPIAATAADADIAKAVRGLTAQDGLFTVYSSDHGGVLHARVPKPDASGVIGQYIYASRLRSGLGSNPVGLDRGAGDFGRVVTLRRVGDRVIIEADNLDYRAQTNNADERRAVRESFATSILWSTDIVATGSDGSLLIDLGSFVVRDELGVAARLQQVGQGSFTLDPKRSFVAREQLAFPDNVELEAVLTFSSSGDGDEVQQTAPDARAVTLTLHHSFVRLPDDDYVVRKSDPRSAVIDMLFYDFSQPLAAQLPQRMARRFRLQKTDPSLARSPVKKPITFYIDSGAPEPIRTALVEGAMWWAEAFEAAGFEAGYQVAILPPEAHPLDIRYNVVQWVHRQTRGWSYGGGVADPRTGEMLKGHVILGSQRVRQDRMIFEGLAGRAKTGTDLADDPLRMSLARIRQLAAHEIGHSLGFNHNMAASSNDRASVMDYPAPLVTATDGELDFSDVYSVGMGAWDLFTVAWLYKEFAPGIEVNEALDAMVVDAYASGLRFVADTHSRPVGAAHAHGSLWDNGNDPIESLTNVMTVRDIALADFNVDRLSTYQSTSDLQTVFAPIYLYHRYQVLAATKLIGGYTFNYGLVRDGADAVTPVANPKQRQALAAVLATLQPSVLRVPPRLQRLMQPPLQDWEPVLGRERVASRLGPVFDPQHAAGVAANLTLSGLLHPQRLGRVALAHATDSRFLSVAELLRQTAAVAFDGNVVAGTDGAAQLAVQEQLIRHLIAIDGNIAAEVSVRADARAALADIGAQLRSRSRSAQRTSTRTWLANQIRQYLDRGVLPDSGASSTVSVPPGSPIGADSCWHCDSAELLR
ncbi:MAG: zinc-dependent metalloprotease [Pseudomonadota bacterium]